MDSGPGFHPVFACHPFDDHPELLFAVMPFFLMVSFSLSLDLDFFFGEVDEDRDTLTNFRFDLQRQPSNSQMGQKSSGPLSSTISWPSFLGSRSGRPPSAQRFISLPGSQIISVMSSKTLRLHLMQQDLGVFDPPAGQNKGTLERPIDCFIIFLEDLTTIQQVIVEAGWC